MRIVVLNLDRTPDRMAGFRALNPHLPGITRVRAVDGRAEDIGGLLAAGVIAPGLRYTQGAIGNALSHMAQWAEAVATGSALTVLEDDAVLCSNFVEEAGRLLSGPGISEWDYIQWGYNFNTVLAYELMPGISPCCAVFDQDSMRRSLPCFHRHAISTSAYRLSRSLGIPAYTVSPRGAEKLLSFCRPLRPLNVEFPLLGLRANHSIDFMMSGAYPAMSAHVAVPPLALTANDHSQSTVQDLTDPTGPAQRAKLSMRF